MLLRAAPGSRPGARDRRRSPAHGHRPPAAVEAGSTWLLGNPYSADH